MDTVVVSGLNALWVLLNVPVMIQTWWEWTMKQSVSLEGFLFLLSFFNSVRDIQHTRVCDKFYKGWYFTSGQWYELWCTSGWVYVHSCTLSGAVLLKEINNTVKVFSPIRALNCSGISLFFSSDFVSFTITSCVDDVDGTGWYSTYSKDLFTPNK